MPLSIDKLNNLLLTQAILPRRYFRLHNICLFIEVIGAKTADPFIISIPEKYTLPIAHGSNIFKIKPINMGDEREVVAEEYARSPDRLELEKRYKELDMESADGDARNINDKLVSNYKKPILLRNLGREDMIIVKDIFRQLKRLKYCVQGIRYKLIIIYKSYFCVLGSNDNIECFYIKNFYDNRRHFLTAVDLELFYEKQNDIITNVRQVKDGIYKVLENNQSKLADDLQNMLTKKREIIPISQSIYRQKESSS